MIRDKNGELKTTAAYVDKNNNESPLVKFSKKVDGTFYVVEAVPDSSYKKIWVLSAYMQKQDPRKLFTPGDQSGPDPHSADPATKSINASGQKSNIKKVLSSMPGANKVDAESMKAFVDAYDGSINPETYAQGMIWGWHAGNAGSTVEYARSNKAFASLPAKLQAQAHYAGENYGSNTIEGIEKQLDILMDTQARLPDSDAEAIDRFEEKITALRSKLKQLKSVDEVREETYYSTGKEFAREFSGEVDTNGWAVPVGRIRSAIMQGFGHIHVDGITGHIYTADHKIVFRIIDNNKIEIIDVFDLNNVEQDEVIDNEYGTNDNERISEKTSLGEIEERRRNGYTSSNELSGASGSDDSMAGGKPESNAGGNMLKGDRAQRNGGQVREKKENQNRLNQKNSLDTLSDIVKDHQLTLDEYAASIDSQKVKAERKRTAQALSELRAAASEIKGGDNVKTVVIGGRVAEVNGANRSRLDYNPDGTRGEKAFAVKEENEHDRLVNQTMTMEQAKRMIEMTFNANGIKEWYDGKYKTAEEWLRGKGAAEVADYAENTENVIAQYHNRIPEMTDYDVTAEEVIEAYLAGTLTGKVKRATNAAKMDLLKSTGKQDSRFYAPKEINADSETWNKANERITAANKEDVQKARAKILFAAHNGELSGVSSKELNGKLRSWSGYSARARQISKKINEGVAPENRWTGIENSSLLSRVQVTDDDIRSMVKSISGESSEYQRNYIGRTMLAIDTHVDWSRLSFVFENKGVLDGNALGYYDDRKTEIHVGTRGYLNTVAHEMGHALDHQWTRDILGGGTGSGIPLSEQNFDLEKIEDSDTRLFYEHFRSFMDGIENAADIRSSYTSRGTESFARFVARFVEWTDQLAGGHIYSETSFYKDRFTAKQFLEFTHLLQEKAKLDMAKAPVSENATSATMTQRRIDELIKDSSAGSRADYAQKWITSISPTDFLNMTLGEKNQNREVFDNMPGDYGDTNNTRDYLGDLKKVRQTPYLAIDITTGEVIGHEGRHRMRALEKQGITSTQIAVSFYDGDGRMIKELNGYGNPLDTISSLKIFNQRGTGQSTTLSDIMPLNEANREAVMERYGREDGRISYQAFEKDGNGKDFWLVESNKDIFSGIEKTYELKKTAYNYILNGEKGEEVAGIVDGQDLKFVRISAQEYVYGRQSQSLEEDSFKKKMRLAPSITDLIKNAEIHYDAPDKKNHKLFPDGFTNYQGRVGIVDTVFKYIVRIGKAKDGKIFYDLNLEVDGKVPRALRTSLIKTSTSDGKVSHTLSSVNPENDNSALREDVNYFLDTNDAAPDPELTETKRQLSEAWREYRELAQELKETEKELAGARKEAEKQAARAERFKIQTRLTKEWHVRNAAINELAKEYISTDLIDEARLPKEDIAEQIRLNDPPNLEGRICQGLVLNGLIEFQILEFRFVRRFVQRVCFRYNLCRRRLRILLHPIHELISQPRPANQN